jgi:hypothetical protein
MIVPLIQIFHLTYLWILEFVPYPEFFIFPYLASTGWLPYRQIIDHHTPGLWLLPVNFANFGFTSPGSFKILLLLVVLIQSAMIYLIGKKLFSRQAAVWAVFFYALWQPFFAGNHLWLDLFLPVFTLPALYFVLTSRFLAAGVFLGLSLIFKQSTLPLLLVPLYMIWKTSGRVKSLLDFIFGMCLPWIPVLFYLQKNFLIPDFIYMTVFFNFTIYGPMSRLVPAVKDLIRISLPLGLVIFSWIKSGKFKTVNVVLTWGLLSVAFGLFRYDLKHFQPALPYFCLVLGIFIQKLRQNNKNSQVAVFIAITLLWSGFFTLKSRQFFTTRFFDDSTRDLVREIKTRTSPGDNIYLLGGQPHLYQLTSTFPPARYFFFPLPWFFRVYQMPEIVSIISDMPQLIVYDTQSRVDGKKLNVYAPLLLKYIQDSYEPIATSGSNIIYSRKISK